MSLARSLSSTKKAFEMLVTGDTITAQEALQFGLVNQLVNDNHQIEVLREHTRAFVHRIICHPAESLELGKQSFYKQITINDLAQAYEFACEKMTDNLEIADCKEGINSFLEKRKPHFKN